MRRVQQTVSVCTIYALRYMALYGFMLYARTLVYAHTVRVHDLVVFRTIMAIALRHNDNHLSLNYTICLFREHWQWLQQQHQRQHQRIYVHCSVSFCTMLGMRASIYAWRYFYCGNGFEVADT